MLGLYLIVYFYNPMLNEILEEIFFFSFWNEGILFRIFYFLEKQMRYFFISGPYFTM